MNAAGAGIDLDAYLPTEEPGSPWAAGGGAGWAEPQVLPADQPGGASSLQDSLAKQPGVLTFKGGSCVQG